MLAARALPSSPVAESQTPSDETGGNSFAVVIHGEVDRSAPPFGIPHPLLQKQPCREVMIGVLGML